MPRISEFNPTAYPSLEHEFPAEKDGENHRLSIAQVRALMQFAASEISTDWEGLTVQQILTALETDKAEKSYTDGQINDLLDLIAKRVRVDAAQSFTPLEKGQAIANIGGSVLAGFRNKIINGDFSINQRGVASVNANGQFFADRWRLQLLGSGSAATAEIVQFSLGAADKPPFFDTAHVRLDITAAGFIGITQYIEAIRSLAGKKVTLTFWARKPTGGTVDLSGVSFNQNFGTGGSPSTVVPTLATVTGALGTTWSKITAIVDIPSIWGKTLGTNGDTSTQPIIQFSGTGLVDIAHVSLVEGDATAEDDPFSPRHIQQELALCQRYYWRGKPGNYFSQFVTASGQDVSWPISFPVTMRTVPAVSIAGTYINYGYSSAVVDYQTRDGVRLKATASGPEALANVDMTNGIFVADAEL